jgi:hypothetical protein
LLLERTVARNNSCQAYFSTRTGILKTDMVTMVDPLKVVVNKWDHTEYLKNVKVVKKAVNMLNSGGFEDFATTAKGLFSGNCSLLIPTCGELKGMKNVMSFWDDLLEAFPDATIDLLEFHDRGRTQIGASMLEIKWKFTGTQVKNIFGIVPDQGKKRRDDHSKTSSVIGHGFFMFEDVSNSFCMLHYLFSASFYIAVKQKHSCVLILPGDEGAFETLQS